MSSFSREETLLTFLTLGTKHFVLPIHSLLHITIDESFASLDHVPRDQLYEYAVHLRDTISKYVGISVSIGIAPTKVLAKLMTEVVKHHAEYKGVLSSFHLRAKECDDLLQRREERLSHLI